MNYSRQRALIMDILKNTKSHPTAEWVHEEAKKTIPKIGVATVYRNLNALVEIGECKKIVVAGARDRFDADTRPHYHVECGCCGKLKDLSLADGVEAAHLSEMVKKAFGVEDDNMELATVLFKDICKECRLKKEKES